MSNFIPNLNNRKPVTSSTSEPLDQNQNNAAVEDGKITQVIYPFKKRHIVIPEAPAIPRCVSSYYKPNVSVSLPEDRPASGSAHPVLVNQLEPSPVELEPEAKILDWISVGSVLSVSCNNFLAEFHLDKFGSGKRGRCINDDGFWLTPHEYEARRGLALNHDWSQSIICGNCRLNSLIESYILKPHKDLCDCMKCYNIALHAIT